MLYITSKLYIAIVPGLSDHDAVIVDILNYTPCYVKPKKKVYCFRKADWTSLRQRLASISNDYFQLNARSVQENWNYFYENLLQANEAYIPVKYISNTDNVP